MSERDILLSPSQRIGFFGVGHIANQLQIWGFDYVLYPFVIWRLGLFVGALVMTLLSFGVCYGFLRFYDWSGKDWLGIETLKSVKESESKSRIAQFSSWILRKGNSAAFFFLAIKFDPFITTAYMRHGSHRFNGLSRRDWRIFLGSLLIGNVYWTFTVFAGISIVELLWKFVSTNAF